MTRLFAGTPFDIPPRCEECGELESECRCTAEEKAKAAERHRQDAERHRRDAERLAPEQQTARVSVQRRKGGRQVTLVEGLAAKANDLPQLLRQLQAECGTGGTIKANEDLLELQGEHADSVRRKLAKIGYRVK